MVAAEEYLDTVNSSEIVNNGGDEKCAPNMEFKDGSCIPIHLLKSMANSYNKEYDNKIKLYTNVETLNPGKYKKYLLKEFSTRLSNVCDNQKCWLKQNFMKDIEHAKKIELNKYTFRHSGPSGQFTWLNTLDINGSMDQYEQKYDDFKFLGAVPIDFDELKQLGIKDLDYKKLYNSGKNKIGIVFNLDEHYKSGSHWVASFADLKKGQVYYYDSYGIPPEKRIRSFMRRTVDAIKDISGIKENKIEVKYNDVRQQFKNSECGVFSMSFILRSVKGHSFNKIIKSKIHDKEINECRKLYFT
jgi:hypothetical protein